MTRLALSRTCALLIIAALVSRLGAAEIAIVTPAESTEAERIAAEELGAGLQRMFPRDRFVAATSLPAGGKAILVGTARSPLVRRHLAAEVPDGAESFVVRRSVEGAREMGVVAGADPRGAMYGVYALLEKLGGSFHLSGDALPPRAAAFGFDSWELADRPLVPDRFVFNWHNFLSGCSTWNLEDWQHWTTRSQKMGYNAIMVHAYGNNPMAGFTFDGTPKPVGYLSTTIKGRDWSTMHVNDVRRLFGGEVFATAAFGADAGLGPDPERVAAAQELMRGVFAHAARRAMGVYLAVDVDTPSANPQELVTRLPESARFRISGATSTVAGGAPGRIWVPNPDTPEGEAFYRAQVEGLRRAYPHLTTLVVWFRRGGTPWMDLKPTDLPAAWQREFAAEIARTPEAEKYWRAAGLFAVGKIVRAFERALQAGGSPRPRLAAGTWGFEFLAGADRFFPGGVPLIGLDYDILHGRPQLGTAAGRAPLREVGQRRPVLPVMWAHHDDGHYVGRPYLPLPEFGSKLAEARAAGFGIIHWTTRPLDLFFTSLARQTWSSTLDQPLAATCRAVAGPWFGEENRVRLADYLEAWMTGAPRFGRETGDWFIDRKLEKIPEIVAGCQARLALLGGARTAGLTEEQRARLEYFRGLEEWMAAFHEAHGKVQESQERLQRGDREGARQVLAGLQPGALIEQFARFSRSGGITRGEQGLVVTMNTRWYSHVVRHRQALGLEAVRVKFGPTSHDLLAQSRGKFTFHFDRAQALWECWGAEETGAEVFVLPENARISRGETPAAWEEIGLTGVASTGPLTLALRPIMAVDSRQKAKPASLPAGDYRVRLLWLEPDEVAAGQRLFDVALRVSATNPDAAFTPLERVDVVKLAGGPRRLIERSYPFHLEATRGGGVEVRLTPVQGKALLCGAVVEPVGAP